MDVVLASDLTKQRLARQLIRDGAELVLMDRNHVFTLAVTWCLDRLTGTSIYRGARDWYRRSPVALISPEAYVLLDIPSQLVDRRVGWRPESPGNPMTWDRHRLAALRYSDRYRRWVEPSALVTRVDARHDPDRTLGDMMAAIERIREVRDPG
jgi:hypothetical protein